MKRHHNGPKVQHPHNSVETKQEEKSKGHVPDTTGPKAPWVHDLGPAKSPPCEDGGDWSQSRGDRPMGLLDPHIALLVLSFIRRSHGDM